MADVKISALPLASTPLAGTEVLPIVQSATTDQVSVANLTAGRAVSAASLTLTTTPLAVGSGGTGLTSGTSGGVLYYSASGTLASSSALAANALVIGGGAGIAPSTTTTGANILTFLGTPSSANLAAAVTDETGSGSLVFGTTPTFTTSALFPAGTVSAPGISVSGDTNTGIYFPAADTISFATAGTQRIRIDSAGNVGIGVTPGFPFQVQTTITNGNYGIYLAATGTTSTGSEVFYGLGIVTSQNVSTGTTSQMIHNLYQGYVGLSNAATTPVATIFRVNPAFLGASPSGTVTSLTAFDINTTSYQHTGTASITITNSYGLYINNQGNVSTGYTKTNAYGLYLLAQTGATNNWAIFSAGGRIVMQGVYDNTAGTANVSVDASGNLTRITSSIKYKKDVVTYENGLSKVLSLRPVTYRSKCEADLDAFYGGFIAEEVDQLGLEEFIERNIDGEVEAVRYPNMVALMASAIQELAAKVAALEAKQ